MDKDKILDYVMNSPHNTNPNVLRTMLDNNSSSGGESLPPITVDDLGSILAVVADLDNVSPKEVIPEQTITIVDTKVEVIADWGGYWPNSEISAKMTFNGIEYDAVFSNGKYEVEISDDSTELFMSVTVEVEYVDESSTTLVPVTFVDVRDDRYELPGDYNISLTIMAPGVKYGLIPM